MYYSSCFFNIVRFCSITAQLFVLCLCRYNIFLYVVSDFQKVTKVYFESPDFNMYKSEDHIPLVLEGFRIRKSRLSPILLCYVLHKVSFSAN